MWIVGQRVLAEFEPELGLGTVIEIVGTRFVEVLFPGAELTRRYAQRGAPLKRIVLSRGHKAKTKTNQSFIIAEVQLVESLYLYKGEGLEVWEYELDHVIGDTSPLSHLLQGRWTHPKTFSLREKAWNLRGRSLEPDAKGLIGPRVSLLPHQLYLAHQISKREFPRVLLADEVGLGKTIEAGLIFSSLRASGRAARVLVLVPESLKHQWLAEMYRRFDEMFSVVDEERSEEEELSQGRSAFQMNQKVICSLDFLETEPGRLEEAMEEPWDLLIIDEAHHLVWSEEEQSEKWQIARELSRRTRGLLLLTATPENRGMETEFGLLHLVDPSRFHNFKTFKKEYQRMHETAALARDIHGEVRTPAFLKKVKEHFKGDSDLSKGIKEFADGGSPDELLRRMIDRHGTGRVLVRNRRSRLKGFAERKFRPHPLSPPEQWITLLESKDLREAEDEKLLALASGQTRAALKGAHEQWLKSRSEWLLSLLKQLEREKVLLICSRAKRAAEIQTWLKGESTIRTALFHEGLEIVERDRQAAWFAQADGAQVLLCSEIGGEGRNFQFASHLVLLDLPLHPDVLEQRIGRLDRIGQNKPIQIHVPFLEGTPEEVLVNWYSKGLESFTEPWNGGAILDPLQKPLLEAVRAYLPKSKTYAKREEKLEKLISVTHEQVEQWKTAQRESVDLLVDLNSFDEVKGKALAGRLKEIDEKPELRDFMDRAFDHFGVEVEDFDSAGTYKVSAHSLTFVENFPGLTNAGERLITYDRAHALVREEVAFLTWDHPIAQGALGLVLEGDLGRASAAIWAKSPLETPAVLELLYVLQATAPQYLEVERDLPLSTFKIFVSVDGKQVKEPAGLDSATLTPAPQNFSESLAGARERFHEVVAKADAAVQKECSGRVAAAVQHRRKRLGEEHERLKQLAKVNPLITGAELKEHQAKLEEGLAALETATPRLEAVRLLLRN